MKKNKSEKNAASAKALAVASVVGVLAIGAAVFAAYNSTMERLVPTNTGTTSTNTWVFDAEPVENPVSDVPNEEKEYPAISPADEAEAEEVALETEEPAEEVNKPVVVDVGNILPVEGEVSHPFSGGELVKSETLGVWKTHDGCDILCELGTDVKSMSEGEVKEIREDPLWGVYVIVKQTNGLEVHYCGLAKELNVKAGQQIKQGEIIGKTGDTCQVEIVQQPHLHLGVKLNGEWVDPMSVVTTTPAE